MNNVINGIILIIMKDQSLLKDDTIQYLEQIKSGSNSILVAVRVRPLLAKQAQISQYETIKVLDGKVLALIENQYQGHDTLRKNRIKQAQYAFDFVFDKNVQTKVIYDKAIRVLLDGLMQGYNGTIIAYGATGCGKTFTMIGSHENPGLMPLSIIDLIVRAQQQRKLKNVLLKASYIEIYNQNIKDLLISEDRNFDLREDPKEGVVIPGITEVVVSNLNQLNTILKVGTKNRTNQSTGANQISSRSHGILQISVETQQKAQSLNKQTLIGKFNLVDLAGSQRASNTTNKGLRMVEGAKINQSLLVLGNCIQALCQATEKNIKASFIPYRGSKLTRLLKDSLGGNCRTILIANISPFYQNFEDTYNTLLYANRAKSIKNNIVRNILSVETHFTNYVNVITNLKKQNEDLRTQMLKREINSPKKINLPSLQNSQNNIEKYQNLIDSHFSKEIKLLESLFECNERIQIISFQILKLERSQQKVKKREIEQKKIMIEENTGKKLNLEKQFQQKMNQRNDILKLLKGSEFLGKNTLSHLLSLYKSKKQEVQALQIKHKNKIYEIQTKEKEFIINSMKQQIKVRDKIIHQQRIIIQKNNIISRITYSKLNNAYDNLETQQTQSQQQSTKFPQKNKSQLQKHQISNKKMSISPNSKKIKMNQIKRDKSVFINNTIQQDKDNRVKKNKSIKKVISKKLLQEVPTSPDNQIRLKNHKSQKNRVFDIVMINR